MKTTIPSRGVPRCLRFALAAMAAILCNEAATAAELKRGPYLQTGSPTGITVRWRTDVETGSIVSYGTESDRLEFSGGNPAPTTEHEVKLLGLSPGTRYFYSIGSLDETLAKGADYFFITHPTPGRASPTRIWAIGDCGTFNTGAGNQVGVRDAYYNHTGSRHTDVWLALGDNAYYNGTDQEYQVNFFDIYPTMLRQSPLWSTIGNHETYSVPAGARIPYLDIFSFPQNGEAGGVASGTENYYSFDYANIHFVCLDSELSDRTTGGPMLTWLQADLEANTNDWLIAFWHSPPHTRGSHDSDNAFDNFGNMIQMRARATSLLESYGVDLVLSGHSHIYERSYLLNGHYGHSSTLTPSMIMDSGSGRPADTGAYLKPETGPGANLGAVYIVAGSSGWATFRTGYHPAMFFSALQVGSVVLDISGNRLDAKFLRETGAIDDSFTMIKGAAPEPLRFCTFQFRNGQTIARWKSVAGQTYQVERTASLDSPQWTPASDLTTATGATTSWTNGVPAGDGNSFYRVMKLP